MQSLGGYLCLIPPCCGSDVKVAALCKNNISMECLGQVWFVQRESRPNISKASQNVRFILQRGVVLFECFDVHWIDANLWPLRCLGALFPVVASPVTHSLFPLWQHHMQQICFIPWQRIRFPCLLLLTRIEGKVQPTENSCPLMLLSDLMGFHAESESTDAWASWNACSQKGARKLENKMQNTPRPPKKKRKRKWRTCAQRTFQPLAVQIHGCEKCN